MESIWKREDVLAGKETPLNKKSNIFTTLYLNIFKYLFSYLRR
jgi:hypothetical protein